MMIKVHILSTCTDCNGQAYLPLGEAVSAAGETYIRYSPCPGCEGSGLSPKWISLQELTTLLMHTQCEHQHTNAHGGIHFDTQDVWDDICEVCDDCGAQL